MRDIRYRTEAFSGTGERDAAEVMAFETFELGNTDILEHLRYNILTDPRLIDTCSGFIRELEDNGFVDDLSSDDMVDFFRQILAEIEKETGVQVKYALWLADKDAVTCRDWYGRDMTDDLDFDCYEVGPVILSDLGFDGTLYGYPDMPVRLEDRIEDLRDQLVDIINERENDHLSATRAAQLDNLYLEVDAQIAEIDQILSQKGAAPMTEIKLLSADCCFDEDYGASIIQYQVGKDFVSFAFSDIPIGEVLANPQKAIDGLQKDLENTSKLPLWSDLSDRMQGLIKDSDFDMLFIEYDDEDWTEDLADEIWEEAKRTNLDGCVRCGEDGCYITVFAGAMGSVNWNGAPCYGEPCLEKKFDAPELQSGEKKESLSAMIQSAEARSAASNQGDALDYRKYDTPTLKEMEKAAYAAYYAAATKPCGDWHPGKTFPELEKATAEWEAISAELERRNKEVSAPSR